MGVLTFWVKREYGFKKEAHRPQTCIEKPCNRIQVNEAKTKICHVKRNSTQTRQTCTTWVKKKNINMHLIKETDLKEISICKNPRFIKENKLM